MKQVFIITIVASLLTLSQTNAQDVNFAQMNLTPQLMNPGATGVFPGWERVSISHRQQWITVGSPFVTSQFSGDFNLFKDKQNTGKGYLGIGANFYHDVAGDAKLGTNQFSLTVSGVINLDKNQSLSLGIQGGGAQRTAQPGNLTWGNQFDGETFDTNLSSNEANSAASFINPDFGAGLFYDYHGAQSSFSRNAIQNMYMGISMYHITSPTFQYYNGSTDKLKRKIIGIIGFDFDLPSSPLVFSPKVSYTKQGASQEILGTLAGKFMLSQGTKYTGIYNSSYFTFGLNYRNLDALGPMFGLEISGITFSAAYEFNISPLRASTNSQGAFEITLQYRNLNNALFKGRRTKGFSKGGGM
ncbi:MAG: type IX secretion system PorP/SprF family membrane protein [Flavobacteriales bacterium]|jgi:type IX secretion system PorP/SprF family membrane protein